MMKNVMLLTIVMSLAILSSCGDDDKKEETGNAASALIGTYEGTFYSIAGEVTVTISSAGGDKVNIAFDGNGSMPAAFEGVSARWADGTTVQVVSPMVMYYTETGKIQISNTAGKIFQFNGTRQ